MNFININLEGVFKFCLPFRKKKKSDKTFEISIDNFILMIRKQNNKETIISEILLKILNGQYNSLMLYKYIYENDSIKNIELMNDLNYDFKKIINSSFIQIPIFIKNKLMFSIVLIQKTYKEKINKNTIQLIELLKEYLD